MTYLSKNEMKILLYTVNCLNENGVAKINLNDLSDLIEKSIEKIKEILSIMINKIVEIISPNSTILTTIIIGLQYNEDFVVITLEKKAVVFFSDRNNFIAEKIQEVGWIKNKRTKLLYDWLINNPMQKKEWDLEELKSFFSSSKLEYGMFKSRILKAVLKELKEKTDFNLVLQESTYLDSRKVKSIIFITKDKK